MKSFAKTAILFLLTFACSSVKAQKANPSHRLFDNYSENISCTTSALEKVFSYKEGSSIEIQFHDFTILGTVSTSIQKYPGLKTVIIKISNFNNAVFAISKREDAWNNITYSGRILNDDYADGFILKQDASGQYSLNKISNKEILQD